MVFSISLESLYYTGLVLSLEMSEGSDICLEITKHKESFQSLTGSSVSGKRIRKRYVQRNIYRVIPVVMTWPL